MNIVYVSPVYLVISDWQWKYRVKVLYCYEYVVVSADFKIRNDAINAKSRVSYYKDDKIIHVGHLHFIWQEFVNLYKLLRYIHKWGKK